MNTKICFIIMLLSCQAVLFPQSQQRNISLTEEQKLVITGGPLIETNFSNFLHSGTDNGHSHIRAGISMGGFLNLGIVPSFSVQGEMIIHYKCSDFEWEGSSGAFRYWGVEIPIYGMYHNKLSNGGTISVGIGPYTEFGFNASFRQGEIKSDLYEKDAESGLPALRDSNTGFAIKFGYEFAYGVQINFSYKASITNLLDANSNVARMRPQAISIGLGWRFGK